MNNEQNTNFTPPQPTNEAPETKRCPICGKDLNDGDCGCDRTIRDPRFESLRALFNDDEEV